MNYAPLFFLRSTLKKISQADMQSLMEIKEICPFLIDDPESEITFQSSLFSR